MDYAISSQQLAVISALSSGASVTAAAEQAGVHRNTIHNWRRNSLYFQHALSEAQYDRALYFREKAEALAGLAFKAIQDLLTDPKTPASVRLRAALAIIETAVTPPEPKKQVELEFQKVFVVPSPAAAGEPAATAPAVHNNAQPASPGEHANPAPSSASEVHNNAQGASSAPPGEHLNPSSPTTSALHRSAQAAQAGEHHYSLTPEPDDVHNSAQAPYRRENPKIGRNETCPCGSGRKYKRCCIQAQAA